MQGATIDAHATRVSIRCRLVWSELESKYQGIKEIHMEFPPLLVWGASDKLFLPCDCLRQLVGLFPAKKEFSGVRERI